MKCDHCYAAWFVRFKVIQSQFALCSINCKGGLNVIGNSLSSGFFDRIRFLLDTGCNRESQAGLVLIHVSGHAVLQLFNDNNVPLKVVIPASSVREVKKHKSALSMLSIQTVDGEKVRLNMQTKYILFIF